MLRFSVTEKNSPKINSDSTDVKCKNFIIIMLQKQKLTIVINTVYNWVSTLFLGNLKYVIFSNKSCL